MPGPVRDTKDLKYELTRLTSGSLLVLHPQQFERVFSGSWDNNEAARNEARQIALDHNCVIDESRAPQMLAFRKL
jgi:hypothetical protein